MAGVRIPTVFLFFLGLPVILFPCILAYQYSCQFLCSWPPDLPVIVVELAHAELSDRDRSAGLQACSTGS